MPRSPRVASSGGAAGEAVLMAGVHRAVRWAGVVRDQLGLTIDRFADRPQHVEIAVDREALQRQGVGAEVPPLTFGAILLPWRHANIPT